jgi:hypothetical protein
MIVYFTASVSGKKDLNEQYKAIIDALKSEGNEVISEHVLKVSPTDLKTETEEDRISHNKQLSKWLNKADIIVAEVSSPSVSVGYEIALALDKNKPVLALHHASSPPPALVGEKSEKFLLSSYDLEELKNTIQVSFDYLLDQVDTRFNFFISPKHQNYLDWISQNRKIPRSVFLRRLIEQHMEENEEYRE